MTGNNRTISTFLLLILAPLLSCNPGPQPIRPGVDACSFCKMSIADNRFGGELITPKGKIYKFDDMHCLVSFQQSNAVENNVIKKTYFVDFEVPHALIEASQSFLLKSSDLHSPMGGNIACFSDENKLKEAREKFKGDIVTWEETLNEHK